MFHCNHFSCLFNFPIFAATKQNSPRYNFPPIEVLPSAGRTLGVQLVQYWLHHIINVYVYITTYSPLDKCPTSYLDFCPLDFQPSDFYPLDFCLSDYWPSGHLPASIKCPDQDIFDLPYNLNSQIPNVLPGWVNHFRKPAVSKCRQGSGTTNSGQANGRAGHGQLATIVLVPIITINMVIILIDVKLSFGASITLLVYPNIISHQVHLF